MQRYRHMTTARHLSFKGFTLIELLVVIGILGILASALIATIDPFEQLKKAQDSNIENASVEYVNATLRYYTTHNALPWGDTAAGGYVGCDGNDGTVSGANLSAATACMAALINDGELKTGFTTATNITKEIFISGSSNTATACYQPQSKSQQRNPDTKYDSTGTATTGCTSQGGSASCYFCAVL